MGISYKEMLASALTSSLKGSRPHTPSCNQSGRLLAAASCIIHVGTKTKVHVIAKTGYVSVGVIHTQVN